MDKHMVEWLGAFMDGELGIVRRRQVDEHLSKCPHCRAELEALKQLSLSLKNDPLPEDLSPGGRFAGEVALKLERHPRSRPQARSIWRTMGWWLVPIGALTAWVFVLVASLLTTAAGAAMQTGLLSELPAWVGAPPVYGTWSRLLLPALNGSLDASLQFLLGTAGRQELFWRSLAGQLALQAVLVLVYWSWLAGWLLPRRRSERVNY